MSEPTIALAGDALAQTELLLLGAYAPPAGFNLLSSHSIDARPGDRIRLEDPEGTPIAELTLTEQTTLADGGPFRLTGEVRALSPMTHGPFRRLRQDTATVRSQLSGPAVAVAAYRPLSPADVESLEASVRAAGATDLLLLVPATGAPEPLIRAILTAEKDFQVRTTVVVLPFAYDGPIAEQIARNYGAESVLTLAAEAQEERPRGRRGVVVFFTGLSGSGKSTIARGVHAAITESGDRTVSMLDGDVVRRMLSAGLTFSREDRDLNIRRIGYVAAEIARHGGMAICAPIAPYTSTRAEVRAMVEKFGDFLLIHISTALEVCEARDRKGLYAKARAGEITAFTGVNDPYEEPTDADLVIDTAHVTEAEAIEAVLAELRSGGWLDRQGFGA